ncbi:hypothetical protein [Synechococcus sp. PCC 7336]|uniref:hypothetical protein n=1 Tax=Synechococcus sp. PCC 7336 TaxID=195250 RepID=UPI00037A5E5C|nr:hypothetical protein [Synechococcus sp. PCC 7336]
MGRDGFARAAIANIPKLLTLLDRNPHSPTYGCFDRSFWHYKIIDFPSGMSQEFVWPLALVYDTDISGNPFYRQSNLRSWVEAGILYAARSAHPDGSCDDYFPFERASGAAAFSLLAGIESYKLLGMESQEILAFFARRADWLAHYHESGQLANHQALIALCLELLGRLLDSKRWEEAKAERLERVLSWQSQEGWFQEYEGCDPGYHTLTIACLAWLDRLQPSDRLKASLKNAVRLAAHFIHPDGSYGGEYTSRNTYNFFPHGFELVGQWLPEALQINDRFLEGLASGLGACYADDRMIGHHTWNYLLAWRDFVSDRPPIPDRQEERIWLPEARLLVDRRQSTDLYLALNKGGAFKLFRDGHLVTSDTQFSLQVRSGRKVRNAVGHLVGQYELDIQQNQIEVRGKLGWAKQTPMTPLNLLILRGVMLTVGRFFPNLIRKLLQKLLIVGKSDAPFSFTRQLNWSGDRWVVRDRLQADSWENVISAEIGCDRTSIYVVMSRTFQMGQLQPWQDLTEQIEILQPGQVLEIERQL